MKEELKNEGIIKEEDVGFLKSKLNLLQGTLYLTPNRIALDAHKQGAGGFGLLGSALKKKVEKKSFGFNIEFGNILKVEQGKHGAEKNVLEITDNNGEMFKVIVKNYQEWQSALNEHM